MEREKPQFVNALAALSAFGDHEVQDVVSSG